MQASCIVDVALVLLGVFVFIRDRFQIPDRAGYAMCDVHCPHFVATEKIRSVLHFHVVVSALSVVRSSNSDGSFGDSLAMGFVLELADAFQGEKKVSEAAR